MLGITLRDAVPFRLQSRNPARDRCPLLIELDAIIDAAEHDGTAGPSQQRPFLTAWLEVPCRHRCVSALLGRDVASLDHLGPADQGRARAAPLEPSKVISGVRRPLW